MAIAACAVASRKRLQPTGRVPPGRHMASMWRARSPSATARLRGDVTHLPDRGPCDTRLLARDAGGQHVLIRMASTLSQTMVSRTARAMTVA